MEQGRNTRKKERKAMREQREGEREGREENSRQQRKRESKRNTREKTTRKRKTQMARPEIFGNLSNALRQHLKRKNSQKTRRRRGKNQQKKQFCAAGAEKIGIFTIFGAQRALVADFREVSGPAWLGQSRQLWLDGCFSSMNLLEFSRISSSFLGAWRAMRGPRPCFK